MAKRKTWAVLFLGLLVFLSGCSVEKTKPRNRTDLNFTLVEDSQIPEELRAIIEEKKTGEFKMTFDTGEFRYIVVGYGTQPTGGYSISVEELYDAGNAVYIKTNFIGPAKGEAVTEGESYPYVVVKIDLLDKSVVFE